MNPVLVASASLVAQRLKHLPTMRETQVQHLGREDLLEKGMATHSSVLAPSLQKWGSKKYFKGFPGGSEVKASACNVGDSGLIPGLGRSPGEGNGNLLPCSCLENPMERGAW